MDFQTQKQLAIKKRFASLRHPPAEEDFTDVASKNHRNRVIQNAADKLKEISKQPQENQKNLNKEDPLLNLINFYKNQRKASSKKEKLFQENAQKLTDNTPLERTNINVYYWYYNDSSSVDGGNSLNKNNKTSKLSPKTTLLSDSFNAYTELSETSAISNF